VQNIDNAPPGGDFQTLMEITKLTEIFKHMAIQWIKRQTISSASGQPSRPDKYLVGLIAEMHRKWLMAVYYFRLCCGPVWFVHVQIAKFVHV
jgi:hypothetical protein